MKRMKLKMKKGMARFLVAIMVIGLLPMMTNNMATVHAAEPSTTAYATPEDLKNWNYGNTIGKIIFGKDENDNPLEWYILGSDSDVNGDNTAIFAASPIKTGVMFEYDYMSYKTYDTSFGTYEGSAPTEVYPNHYGASDLRATLNEMATSDTYFTAKEQSLLQETTVKTVDTKATDESYSSSKIEYTTTDVLYALHGGDSYDDRILYAGSSNSKELPMSTYWNTGEWFWLRTPYDNYSEYAFMAAPGDYAADFFVGIEIGVQPASNLNLSSVSFASAALAASSDTVETGTIQTGKAMTLRLDGSNMEIGNVIYDSARNDMIFVKKSANATGTVSLVVQGNDGNNDWYYSKTVTASEVIRMADIKTALNLSTDISVDECKIWLETTMDGVAYAKPITNGTYTCVDKIDVTIDSPTPGETLASEVTVQNTCVVSITLATKWTVGTTDVTGAADYNTVYTVTTNFTTTDSAYFGNTLTATMNGESATITKNTDGTVTVSYTFPAIEDNAETPAGNPADAVTPPDAPDIEDPIPNPNEDDSTSEDSNSSPDSTEAEDGKDEVPKTGDASSPIMPFMLMLASASYGMLLLMTNGRMGKKHKKNKSEQ